jgi:peptidoglycan hydrolase-like protein with peptidoglycan-binding domain
MITIVEGRRRRALLLGLSVALVAAAVGAAPASASERAASVPVLALGAGFDGRNQGAVARLQSALLRLGYRPGPIDGLYGPLTAAAVSRLQAANRVAVDGIAGPVTQRALRLQSRVSAAAVRRAQRRLRKLGHRPGPIDGIFGPRTVQAVHRFKSESGLPGMAQLGRRVLARLRTAVTEADDVVRTSGPSPRSSASDNSRTSSPEPSGAKATGHDATSSGANGATTADATSSGANGATTADATSSGANGATTPSSDSASEGPATDGDAASTQDAPASGATPDAAASPDPSDGGTGGSTALVRSAADTTRPTLVLALSTPAALLIAAAALLVVVLLGELWSPWRSRGKSTLRHPLPPEGDPRGDVRATRAGPPGADRDAGVAQHSPGAEPVRRVSHDRPHVEQAGGVPEDPSADERDAGVTPQPTGARER